ncbi:MAG: hypothetical protein ACJAT1_001264 [Marivirga sp.]|jgi:hypothetical protein
MKKNTKLFALLAGIILFASACAGRTCPTYAENNTSPVQSAVEKTV